MSDVYTFGNGVQVYRDMLTRNQIQRYTLPGNPNLHEPVEEGWIVRLLEETPPECTFVDLGAGIGYYSILAKRVRPNARVFAVEPLPQHFEACARTVALNGLAGGSITMVSNAVAGVRGDVEFMDKDYGSSMVLQPGRKTIRVNAITMDDLLAIVGGRIDLMKMDIQGEELNALQGAKDALSADKIAALIVGTHSSELHQGVLKLLTSCGGEVIFDEPKPAHQPDGLVIARFET